MTWLLQTARRCPFMVNLSLTDGVEASNSPLTDDVSGEGQRIAGRNSQCCSDRPADILLNEGHRIVGCNGRCRCRVDVEERRTGDHTGAEGNCADFGLLSPSCLSLL